MANDRINLFNFYRRYRWREQDFERWQQGQVEHSRGMFEGLFGGGIMAGFEVAPSGAGLAVTISEGIASGPTGYLHVNNVPFDVELEAPNTDPRRDLLVMRQSLVNAEFITNPTDPFDTVPLRTEQQTVIEIIQGNQAESPEYPAKGDQDVVICGIRLQPGQTDISRDDLDFEVRDSLGKNSRFQQNQAKFDERCLVARQTNSSVKVGPSQTLVGQNPKNFLYINKGTPSRFPLNAGGEFTHGDTFLNFQTGAVTGADETTPAFTPVIPTAGQWVVATVSLQGDDNLNVSYGNPGTRAECFQAIANARTSGNGSVALPSQMMRLAFVVLGSADGANITELDTVDGRSTFYFGGPDTAKTYPNIFLSALGAGDETNLADAVNALPTEGGVLLVMDDIVVPNAVTIPNNTKIIGRGKGVKLICEGATGMIFGDNVTVQDLVLELEDNTRGIIFNGNYNVAEKCLFEAPAAASGAVCITVAGDANHIGECVFEGVLSPSLATGIEYEPGTSENSDEYNIFLP